MQVLYSKSDDANFKITNVEMRTPNRLDSNLDFLKIIFLFVLRYIVQYTNLKCTAQ